MPRRHHSAEFPRRLRQARKDRGLTAEQLALAVGFQGRASISNMERGRQGVSIDQVEDLARALGVRACWLTFGEGEMYG